MQKSRDSNFFSFLSVNYKTAELPKIVFLFLKLKESFTQDTNLVSWLLIQYDSASSTHMYLQKKIWECIVDKFRCITF